MMSFFKKKEENRIIAGETDIVAIANAKMIPLEEVKDEAFAQKMMGDGVAFELKEDVVVSPCDGNLDVAFPTGHAYGITMKNGVGLMVHIGINTVSNKGSGFKMLVKQGQAIKAGDPLVKLDRKSLSERYDMTTMLIITEEADQKIQFIPFGEVRKGQKINQ